MPRTHTNIHPRIDPSAEGHQQKKRLRLRIHLTHNFLLLKRGLPELGRQNTSTSRKQRRTVKPEEREPFTLLFLYHSIQLSIQGSFPPIIYTSIQSSSQYLFHFRDDFTSRHHASFQMVPFQYHFRHITRFIRDCQPNAPFRAGHMPRFLGGSHGFERRQIPLTRHLQYEWCPG